MSNLPFNYKHPNISEVLNIIIAFVAFFIFMIVVGYFLKPSIDNSSQYPEDTCQDASGNFYPC